MKKLLILLILPLLLIPPSTHSQVQFFMVDKSSGVPPPAGTTVRTEGEQFDQWSGITVYANTDADASLYNIGFGAAGQWTDYSINAAAGTHNISVRVSTSAGGGNFYIKSGTTTLATLTAPAGAPWTTLTGTITLAAGLQTLRIESAINDLNINWFEIDNSYSPVYARYAYLNLCNEYQSSPSPWVTGLSQWNTMGATASQITTAGGYSKALQTYRLTQSGWTFVNVSALISTGGGQQPSTNGDAAFDNLVVSTIWKAPNGAQVKFTGLDVSKNYDVFILPNSASYEPNTVSFTANGVTSAAKNTASNYGSSAAYPNWENDPAFARVSAVSPNASGEIIITCNLVSGTYVPIAAIVIKQN